MLIFDNEEFDDNDFNRSEIAKYDQLKTKLCYLLKRDDGRVSIVMVDTPKDGQDAVIELLKKGMVFTSVKIVDPKILIKMYMRNNDFRDAWKLNGDNLDVHLPTARDIHLDRIKTRRAEYLGYQKGTDWKMIRQLEATVKMLLEHLGLDDSAFRDLASERQKLRDVTKTIDLESAETPEQLKAVWPEELL